MSRSSSFSNELPLHMETPMPSGHQPRTNQAHLATKPKNGQSCVVPEVSSCLEADAEVGTLQSAAAIRQHKQQIFNLDVELTNEATAKLSNFLKAEDVEVDLDLKDHMEREHASWDGKTEKQWVKGANDRRQRRMEDVMIHLQNRRKWTQEMKDTAKGQHKKLVKRGKILHDAYKEVAKAILFKWTAHSVAQIHEFKTQMQTLENKKVQAEQETATVRLRLAEVQLRKVELERQIKGINQEVLQLNIDLERMRLTTALNVQTGGLAQEDRPVDVGERESGCDEMDRYGSGEDCPGLSDCGSDHGTSVSPNGDSGAQGCGTQSDVRSGPQATSNIHHRLGFSAPSGSEPPPHHQTKTPPHTSFATSPPKPEPFSSSATPWALAKHGVAPSTHNVTPNVLHTENRKPFGNTHEQSPTKWSAGLSTPSTMQWASSQSNGKHSAIESGLVRVWARGGWRPTKGAH
ncbi:hypothetical protein FB451DRAFT_1195792 [Mycena latifolia]|nr:hypothetical protein FB451DRAFT_1195792 [Mycena latifolia]